MLRSSEESRVGVTNNPWNDVTVAQMLDQVTADRPHATALVEGDRSVTFVELQAARNRIGAALTSLGVGDGTHVAILMTKGHDYTALLHGLWMIGAVAIPLNTMWTAREVKRALTDTDTELLIIDTASDSTDWRTIVSHLDLPTDGPVEQRQVHKMRRVVDWSGHPDLCSRGSAGADEARKPSRALPRSSRQESLFLFTSGSSSAPKAVVLRQDGLLGTAHYFAKSLQMDGCDKFLSLGPYFHAGGIVQMLVANQSGAAQYVFPRVDIPTIAAVAVRDGCTVVTGFDPVLVKLFDAIDAAGGDLPFRSVAASPGVEVYDMLRSREISVITMYAMSEGGNMITLATPEDETFAHGKALPGLSVRICDAAGQPVGVGEEGEICFKGWNLFRGYYNAEGATPHDRATDAEHYFHTGDIGRLEDDGRLRYLGRLSSMIKTAGENVSSTEVETFLAREVPEVATAAVVGVPNAEWGEAVVAFVQLVPGSRPFDESWLKDSCRGKLAGYKIPKRFVEVRPDQWPVADTGKLSRVTLVENFLADLPAARP
jgi:fatty-acyl-CoA synthase